MMSLRSEGEVSVDAKDGSWSGGRVSSSSDRNSVGTGWSVRWDGPLEGVVIGGVIDVVLGVVLVIEGGSVPVDVDVNVGDFDGVTDDTGKVEGNIGSLDSWGWDVVSVVGVEGEDTGIIRACSVYDISSSFEVGDFALHKLFDEVSLGEVLWFEEWD